MWCNKKRYNLEGYFVFTSFNVNMPPKDSKKNDFQEVLILQYLKYTYFQWHDRRKQRLKLEKE